MGSSKKMYLFLNAMRRKDTESSYQNLRHMVLSTVGLVKCATRWRCRWSGLPTLSREMVL